MTSIGALNIHEAARALKIDEDSVNRLVLDGEIPAAKLSDEWIFLQEDILTLLRIRISRKPQNDEGGPKKLPFGTEISITAIRGGGRGPRLTTADVDALALECAKMSLK